MYKSALGCTVCATLILASGCSSSNNSSGDAGMTADGGTTSNVVFTPSNFAPSMLSMTNLADIEGNAMSVGCNVDTDMGTINCAEQPAMTTGYTATQLSQPNGENVEVFAMKSFKLDEGSP